MMNLFELYARKSRVKVRWLNCLNRKRDSIVPFVEVIR